MEAPPPDIRFRTRSKPVPDCHGKSSNIYRIFSTHVRNIHWRVQKTQVSGSRVCLIQARTAQVQSQDLTERPSGAILCLLCSSLAARTATSSFQV